MILTRELSFVGKSLRPATAMPVTFINKSLSFSLGIRYKLRYSKKAFFNGLFLRADEKKMTRIKKIHLHGFKSFAKPLDLEFGNGFNVILGPNGSGKSNIADSICFVLGKLSAKSLRAEKSSNLIFNGGKKSNPMKEAEVSLFFDNSSKEFPGDNEEIKITRVVRQNGTSVYKINDETRTREQIIELLAVAKIDPDGHNIVLQGDIVRFMEMKNEERRELIEEISGISVYEDKKHKALLELDKVEASLNEAMIILNEREAHLRELKKDRDQALKYKDLEQSIKSSKATYLYMQVEEREEKIKEFDRRVKKYNGEINDTNKKIESVKQKILNNKHEINEINKRIEEKGEKEALDIQKKIEDVKANIIRDSERLQTCKNEISKILERRKQIKETINENGRIIIDLENSRKELESQLKKLENEERSIEEEIGKFRKRHNIVGKEELESIDKEINDNVKELEDIREKRERLLQRKFKIEAEISTIEEKIKNISKIIDSEKLDRIKKELENFDKELNKLNNESLVLISQLSKAKQELMEKDEELFKFKAREAGIKGSLFEDRAIKRILDLGEKEIDGIYGTIAQLGKVEGKYSLALEVAAGARIKSIVVKDDKVAARCIEILKKEKLGIATFLPLNKMQERAKISIKDEGVIGNAMGLVSFDKKFEKAFSYVFGNTIVVSDINAARRIGIGRARMVTLDGDLVEQSGAMIGGYRHARGIGFVEKIESDSNLENEVEKLRKTKALIEERIKKNEELANKFRKEKSLKEAELIKLEGSFRVFNLDNLRKELEQLRKDNVFKELKDIENELEKFEKDVKTLRERKDKLISQDITGETANSLKKLDERRMQIRERNVRIKTENKNIELQKNNIYIPEREKTILILRQNEKEDIEFNQEAGELDKRLSDNKKSLKESEILEARFQREYKDLFAKRNKLNEDIEKDEERISREELSLKEVYDKVNNVNISRAKVVAEFEALNKEYDEFRGAELRKGISLEKLKEEIKRFEQLLKDMGNVNLRALEIYDNIKIEYEELLGKVEKLKTEKESVLQMMYEIESKKKDMFMKTFEIIAANFNRIFSSLTTKGEAFLELENKDEPLNAGIDIKVRIAGTKYLDIKSLSGGEKTLTALAFIFAIQEHQPASFYLLDEVDAALDKTNSEMLSKLVGKYAKNAQYILISHNDQVISEAEQIYGVSMQQTGISKIVSLKV